MCSVHFSVVIKCTMNLLCVNLEAFSSADFISPLMVTWLIFQLEHVCNQVEDRIVNPAATMI